MNTTDISEKASFIALLLTTYKNVLNEGSHYYTIIVEGRHTIQGVALNEERALNEVVRCIQ